LVRVGKKESDKEYVSVRKRNRLLGREKSRAKNQGEIARIAVAFV